VGVIVRITLVIVAGSVAHAIGERETVTVGVKARIDAEKPRALQTGKDGKLELPHHDRPLLRRFSQEGEREAVADIVVADGAVKFRMKIVLRSIREVDRGRNVD